MVPTEHKAHLRSQSLPIRELKLLVLNVVTPTKAEVEGKSFYWRNHMHYPRDTIEAVACAEEVLLELAYYVSHLVKRETHAARYSQLLYERLKTIRLCLDGKEYFSWNVSERTRKFHED